jgi:hypothetical protein
MADCKYKLARNARCGSKIAHPALLKKLIKAKHSPVLDPEGRKVSERH